MTGWRRACHALGLPEGEPLRTEGERLLTRVVDGIAGGRAGATHLLDTDPRPTAIVAVSDDLAVGAMQAITERGLRPGPDVAVTGVGDSAVCTALVGP